MKKLLGWLLVSMILGKATSVCVAQDGPFAGYGLYRNEFRELCSALREDGRSQLIADLLKPYSERDPECIACRPLFLILISNCKGGDLKKNRKKESKEAEPENAETPAADNQVDVLEPVVEGEADNTEQTSEKNVSASSAPKDEESVPERDPSALVIERASRLFRRISENNRISAETLLALGKLTFIFQDKNLVKGAAREYLSTLVTYIQAPFLSLPKIEKKKEHDSEGTSSAVSAPPNVDSLFEE